MTDVSANTVARLLESRSFVELGARERARALLDEGSFRELLDPFDRVTSPWLPKQGIVTQADDGVVVAMAAQQNVYGALSGGPMAILAGIAAVVLAFALVPVLDRIGRKKSEAEPVATAKPTTSSARG